MSTSLIGASTWDLVKGKGFVRCLTHASHTLYSLFLEGTLVSPFSSIFVNVCNLEMRNDLSIVENNRVGMACFIPVVWYVMITLFM